METYLRNEVLEFNYDGNTFAVTREDDTLKLYQELDGESFEDYFKE